MFRSFRNAFITGLILLLPLGITLFVLSFLLEHVGAPASKLFFGQAAASFSSGIFKAYLLNILATLMVVLIVTMLGYISRYFLGRFMFLLAEKIIEKLPFVRSLYRTSKQIINTFSENKRSVFQKAVLVEFPRKGIYSLGFITCEAQGEIQQKTEEVVVSVFIPTTPNPTSGFLLFLPKNDLIELDMSVGDALKAIISGGVLDRKSVV